MSDSNPLFTCRGKGGTYRKLGVSKGSGPRNGERLVVYQDCVTDAIYHREIRDFEDRMMALPDADLEAELERILDNPAPPSKELLEILALDSEGGHCD